jgi:predicted MFS family arabinose efflux permease
MLIADIGWRPMLQSIAAVSALLIVPILALVRNDPPVSAADRAAAPPPPAPRKAMEILTSRGFWTLMIVLSLLLSGFTGLNTNLANFGQERGLSLNQVAGVVMALSVIGLPAAFLWGYLADKVEHRFLFAAAALAGAAGAAALAFTYGFVPVIAVSAIVGLVFGGLFPLMGASLARQFGAESLGRATGFAAICIALSSFGAPIFARLHELWGDYTPVMLVVAATSLAAAGAALLLRYGRA